MVITSFDASGEATKRVVSRLERGGQIFVAVNHWPRAWARRIQLNPNVQITYGEITRNYNAVVLKGRITFKPHLTSQSLSCSGF